MLRKEEFFLHLLALSAYKAGHNLEEAIPSSRHSESTVSVTAWTAKGDYLLTELKLNVSKKKKVSWLKKTEKAAKSGNYAYKVQIL